MENVCVCILVSGACGCAAPSAERFMLKGLEAGFVEK